MPDEPKPGSYIDTQGMGAPLSAADAKKVKKQEYKPAIKTPRRLFTPEYAKEMKILINEVLDEREYKKRLAGAYDDVKPLPVSYFDTEHFKHKVTEDEPPYQDWSQ
tara:strand:- start:133 stop:450 length:318 start_codon:yes stop_codon:yes gene_type:complete